MNLNYKSAKTKIDRTIKALLALVLTACAGSGFSADQAKPNIVLILGDDVGLGDVHCTGGHYRTPNIDALAAGGTRFEYCYAAPLCDPSRTMLLTGRYPFRTGFNNNHVDYSLPAKTEIMISTVLKNAGYESACVGKWSRLSGNASTWGFDESMSFRASGRYWGDQKAPEPINNEYILNGKATPFHPGEYYPDMMHDFIVGFLERNKDRPFFLYYPMQNVHVPILPTPDTKPGTDKKQNSDPLYVDTVEYMDKLVGKLMAELDRLGLRTNTLVIFTGDNGTAPNFAQLSTVDGKQISGRKGTMLEGGSRVPLIVNWPGTTPAGRVRQDLIDLSDFFSTFVELAGAKLPAGITLDSHSFAPQIKGQPGTPRDWVYVELAGKSYVRDARYKLTNGGQLFDLKDAPFTERLLPASPENQETRARLQKILDQHPAIKAGTSDGNSGKK